MLMREMIMARPWPFAGMRVWMDVHGWVAYGPDEITLSAATWREGRSSVMLPGEPGCPLLPTEMQVAVGGRYLYRSIGQWMAGVRGGEDGFYGGCIPVPDDYVLRPVCGDYTANGKHISNVTNSRQAQQDPPTHCPRCRTETSAMPLSPGSRGWHCESCGWPAMQRVAQPKPSTERAPYVPPAWAQVAIDSARGGLVGLHEALKACMDSKTRAHLEAAQRELWEAMLLLVYGPERREVRL
ncbi:MAG: hypothetical protein KKC18_06835 [Chloroflexi bacterium]|nr:hypothetical protein [Chloroflexota bacterium]